MRGTGQSTEFDVPKVTIWSANGWGLHFAKAYDETVYREDQLSETHKQTNILKRRIFASFLFVLLLHLSLIGWYGCTQQINGVFSWSSRILFPTHIIMIYTLQLVSASMLHVIPLRYSEHASCGIICLFQIAVLFTNPIRLHRMSLLEDVGAINEIWIQLNTPVEFMQSARDMSRVVLVNVIDMVFHQTCDRVRTNVSITKVLCLVIIFASMLLSSLNLAEVGHRQASCSAGLGTTLGYLDAVSDVCSTTSHKLSKDAGEAREAFTNLFSLIFGLFANWYSAYLTERVHRENWALRRQAEYYEKAGETQRTLEMLLGLFCPVTMYFSGGKITAASALEDHFGPGIESFRDLPTETRNGMVGSELEDLAAEIQASRVPSKRQVVIRPRGGAQIFNCTVSAVVVEGGTEILFGFQIHESYESAFSACADMPAMPVQLLQTHEEPEANRPELTETEQAEEKCAVPIDVVHSKSEVITKPDPRIEDSLSVDDRGSMMSADLPKKFVTFDSESVSSAPARMGQTAQETPLVKQAKKSMPHRVSPVSLEEMQRVSIRMNCTTSWLRAVHSGYGQDLRWRKFEIHHPK